MGTTYTVSEGNYETFKSKIQKCPSDQMQSENYHAKRLSTDINELITPQIEMSQLSPFSTAALRVIHRSITDMY